ncbi:1-phosphofructokinase family hexose kinase [Microvirga guangxiensis]|uniref:Phosphofructokinase n=1 Tax=Microvirga guangxiensis TaxID=549386 RepID=A0A1G5KAR0_9HYPH|nr:1-phosphofructokinase family hexose kinase [Microvirga guangxiensis]SCY97148.1 6-phosphofructokinase [Microvirga guangxiensis]
MKPVVTLTLNPSIDGSSEAEAVRPIRKVRTSNERYEPGGGGVNVTRVIRELGGSSLALYLAGGVTGAVLEELLAGSGIAGRRIAIEDQTRVSLTVFERSTGLEYRFVPEGPHVAPSEWQECLAVLGTLECEYLVASGSIPRGVPTDFYVRVAAIARERGMKLVLDTSGEALRETIAAGGIHLAKPSLGEFEHFVGRSVKDPGALEEAAMEVVRSGRVDLLAVTMGHEGAVLAHAGGVLRLPAVKVDVRSAVGAGDSFVAAMTLALARGAAPREAFRWGVAAGTAAVLTPGTGLCKRGDVERLFDAISQKQGALAP